jgi:hypothetical protein
MPIELLQVTAQYSNAVLVAIMPYVSDFASRLELPIPQPVSIAQVQMFHCSPRSDHIGGRVSLAGGHEFWFDHGAVVRYTSPSNYFGLQEPSRMPEFYGPVKVRQDEAMKIARDALKRLGYTDDVLHFDAPPQVKPPPRSQGRSVARYLVEWLRPLPEGVKSRPPGMAPKTAAVEVDAATGQIHMLVVFLGWETRLPDPKIGVSPPVLAGPPQSQPAGGTKIVQVGEAYSQAFLAAILPQLSDFVSRSGVAVRVPITTNDVDMPDYVCGLVPELPFACVYLKTGDRFWYEHGQVIDFDAVDAHRWVAPNSPGEDKPREKFYGSVNISADEALAVVRKAMNQLGRVAQLPLLKEKPVIVPPAKYGTNFFYWRDRGTETCSAEAEVNASTKKIEALMINNPRIWREPPKIDVPTEAKKPIREEPAPTAPLPPGSVFSMPATSPPPPRLPGTP